MNVITPDTFRRLPKAEQQPVADWLGRHNLDPNNTAKIEVLDDGNVAVTTYARDPKNDGRHLGKDGRPVTEVTFVGDIDDPFPGVPA